MHEVVVIALQDSVAVDLGIPSQVFGDALDSAGHPFYRVRLCSVDGRPVRTNAGFSAVVEHDLSIVDEADTVIVAPGREARESGASGVSPAVADALHAAEVRGARIVAICTGAFLLAAVGLLDGRRATTYWRRTDEFRRQFPRVRLEPDVLFVDDGVLTSAGVAAGFDVCLHIVRTDLGVAAANDAARHLVMPPTRPGGQAQFIERHRPADDRSRLSDVLDWASGTLDATLSVELLAARASMSERSFTRHFREHTGTSPAAWLTGQRLARARELLETTDLYIDEIARLSGLGTATHMRAQFQKRLGQSPSDYRRVFRPVSA
ncbi:helix-turn-helix domain-containing protein [soil metagenome]